MHLNKSSGYTLIQQQQQQQQGGDFNDFLFLPLLGEMIQFDKYIFQMGVVQPPSRKRYVFVAFFWQTVIFMEKFC